MPELRKDPIIDRWVVIAEDRAARPQDFRAPAARRGTLDCQFCEGNERHTPGEIHALRQPGSRPDGPGWRVRVVPNKYPALLDDGNTDRRCQGLFQWTRGVGVHEVIIESPRHLVSTTDLSDDEVCDVFFVYRDRLRALRENPTMACGLLFKNVRSAAGASVEHAHSQIIGMPLLPGAVQEELTASLRHYQQNGCNVWIEMIQQELGGGERIVLRTPHFVAFCPFASRFPFETWILPVEPAGHFEKTPDDRLRELARLARRVVGRIESVLDRPAYNFLLHTAPFDAAAFGHCQWRIEVFPRTSGIAGFELGTGCYINSTAPETAAEMMRGACTSDPPLTSL